MLHFTDANTWHVRLTESAGAITATTHNVKHPIVLNQPQTVPSYQIHLLTSATPSCVELIQNAKVRTAEMAFVGVGIVDLKIVPAALMILFISAMGLNVPMILNATTMIVTTMLVTKSP